MWLADRQRLVSDIATFEEVTQHRAEPEAIHNRNPREDVGNCLSSRRARFPHLLQRAARART
jgi:hypothetical protein